MQYVMIYYSALFMVKFGYLVDIQTKQMLLKSSRFRLVNLSIRRLDSILHKACDIPRLLYLELDDIINDNIQNI